jgi:hypothetical protein
VVSDPPAPEALGRLILEADPQYRRISPGEADRLVAAALADGRALAAEMESGDPRALAAARGLAIEEAEADGFGTTIVLAEWRGSRITLYREPLARLSALAGFDVAPIYVAHELYHVLDAARAVPLARRHRVRIVGRWTSGLASLPEIAAGGFAQALLRLPCHPKWLELQLAREAKHLVEEACY